jgi:hypothetical protein
MKIPSFWQQVACILASKWLLVWHWNTCILASGNIMLNWVFQRCLMQLHAGVFITPFLSGYISKGCPIKTTSICCFVTRKHFLCYTSVLVCLVGSCLSLQENDRRMQKNLSMLGNTTSYCLHLKMSIVIFKVPTRQTSMPTIGRMYSQHPKTGPIRYSNAWFWTVPGIRILDQ